MAAGAIHAARKKKQAELAKKKEKLAKQRAADDEAASNAYAQIDASSVGSIDRDQVRQLLAAVTGQAEIDEDGLEMVVKAVAVAAQFGWAQAAVILALVLQCITVMFQRVERTIKRQILALLLVLLLELKAMRLILPHGQMVVMQPQTLVVVAVVLVSQ